MKEFSGYVMSAASRRPQKLPQEMNTVGLQENAVLKEPRAGSWRRLMTGREEQVFLILTLIIGAVVGLIVVAFILLTERFGARLYPAARRGGASSFQRLALWEWDTCCSDFFRMRGEAEFHKRRRRCTRARAAFRSRQFWESSFAHPPRWQAEYRWGEKAHRFK